MQISTRVMTGAAAAAVLALGAWAPSQADPANAKNAFPITVSCDNGHTYTVVGNGNGTFTPAHDLASTATLIPVSFGELTFTITAPDGTVIDTETQPPAAKKGASVHNKNATVHCTFSGSQTAPDGTTFSIVGSVVGFVTK